MSASPPPPGCDSLCSSSVRAASLYFAKTALTLFRVFKLSSFHISRFFFLFVCFFKTHRLYIIKPKHGAHLITCELVQIATLVKCTFREMDFKPEQMLVAVVFKTAPLCHYRPQGQTRGAIFLLSCVIIGVSGFTAKQNAHVCDVRPPPRAAWLSFLSC